MHHVQYVSLEHSAQNITLRNVLENSSLALPPSPGMSRTVIRKQPYLVGLPFMSQTLGACGKPSCSSDTHSPLGSLTSDMFGEHCLLGGLNLVF